MRRRLTVAIILVGLSLSSTHRAQATTIDTFEFTQTGWVVASFNNGIITGGSADPGGILTGTFTGTVEPGGLIEQSDLTAFSDSYVDDGNPRGLVETILGSLSLFSYNIAGGASSLDIAGFFSLEQTCVGAAVSLDSNCTARFNVSYATPENGSIFPFSLVLPNDITAEQPVITLVSSVTTGTPVPEPPSVFLLLGSLVVLGGLGTLHNRSSKA